MDSFLIEAKFRLPYCEELVYQALRGEGLNSSQAEEVFGVLGTKDGEQALQIWQATKARIISEFERKLSPISLSGSDSGL